MRLCDNRKTIKEYLYVHADNTTKEKLSSDCGGQEHKRCKRAIAQDKTIKHTINFIVDDDMGSKEDSIYNVQPVVVL